jgi:hypothetical protein
MEHARLDCRPTHQHHWYFSLNTLDNTDPAKKIEDTYNYWKGDLNETVLHVTCPDSDNYWKGDLNETVLHVTFPDSDGNALWVGGRSVGCIFAEILGRKAFLQGKNYQDQLNVIFQAVGMPTDEDLQVVPNQVRLGTCFVVVCVI